MLNSFVAIQNYFEHSVIHSTKLFQQNPNLLICYNTSIFLQLDRCTEFCPSATLSTQIPTLTVDQTWTSKPCTLTQR